MSAPEQIAMTLDEYLRQVEESCSDLSPQVRHRLLADLEVHLRDQADDTDLVATLGSPVDYARELRAAMGLPELAPGPPPVRRRRWLLPALIIGVALAVVLGVIAVVVASTSSPHSPTGPSTATSAPPTAEPSSVSALVLVPSVVGELEANAVAQLEGAGLTVKIHAVKDTAAPPGRVVMQAPAAASKVLPGSTVQLRIATR